MCALEKEFEVCEGLYPLVRSKTRLFFEQFS